jgi:hypothetical protein
VPLNDEAPGWALHAVWQDPQLRFEPGVDFTTLTAGQVIIIPKH